MVQGNCAPAEASTSNVVKVVAKEEALAGQKRFEAFVVLIAVMRLQSLLCRTGRSSGVVGKGLRVEAVVVRLGVVLFLFSDALDQFVQCQQCPVRAQIAAIWLWSAITQLYC